TLTIDDDVSTKLKAKLKSSADKTFKDIVNETLRLGLLAEKDLMKNNNFRVRSRPLGIVKGLNYDNIGELIEQVEGINK
ncbi:MAG: hypothetical protein LH472_09020, partial [Pyrinomonadaceae bacterium]|nr:hypothetical protein [Pyrinomonadaceae bacterium]